MRILVVDDDLEDEDHRDLFKLRLTLIPVATVREVDAKTRREILNRELAKDGFDLEFAFSGDEALTHYCQRGPYDLVLTDLYHPGIDGVELSRVIPAVKTASACAGFSRRIAEAARLR